MSNSQPMSDPQKRNEESPEEELDLSPREVARTHREQANRYNPLSATDRPGVNKMGVRGRMV